MTVSNPATPERSRIHRMDVFFHTIRFFLFFFNYQHKVKLLLKLDIQMQIHVKPSLLKVPFIKGLSVIC